MLKLVSFHIQAHLNAFLQILEYFSQICFGASSERITLYKLASARRPVDLLTFLVA